MGLVASILFDVLLFIVWPAHYIYNQFLLGEQKCRRQKLRMLDSQIRYRWRWDRDVLSAQENKRLMGMAERAQALQENLDDVEKTEEFVARSLKQLDNIKPRNKWTVVKEWLELIIVVFGVVMGVRAPFLQPFKIPTGSMQPTLFGIQFTPCDEGEANVNVVKRLLNYVNLSRRYTDVVIREDGELKHAKTRNPFFFFPYTNVRIGDQNYKLPGPRDNVLRYIRRHRLNYFPFADQKYFRKGQVLARGYLELGDHLFVNRVWYNFVEPKHGDITVFTTDGIRDKNNHKLRGQYYIKRLVGLPGDQLKIANRKLYIKVPRDTEFKLAGGAVQRAFDRIYSFKGGYRGYSNPDPKRTNAQYLTGPDDVFELKKDEYFLLGDNSENSADSRFWGVVPRRNIVGRATFVYWPFSRRWGTSDRVEPEDFPSLPTSDIGIFY